jgi:opacity protein-like surface antigen
MGEDYFKEDVMKKILLISLAVFLLGYGLAFAEEGKSSVFSLDGAIGLGTEPESGFGSAFAVRFGVSQDFLKVFKKAKRSKHTENLQLRADLSYLKWEQDISGIDVSYRRIPIFFGGRYIFPTKLADAFSIYVEGGLEISLDKAEAVVPPTTSVSESETNIGITPGVGIMYPFNEKLSAGLDLRGHFISDNYWTWMLSLNYNFGNR